MEQVKFDFNGRTALVTGGSRGIGLEMARRLLESGANVAVCARKADKLAEAAEALGHGDRLLAQAAHVADPDGMEALVAAIEERFGGLDVVMANVGMNLPTPSVSELDPGLWQKIIATNLDGAFLTARTTARLLTAGGGAMVFVSSVAARRSAPMMGVYGVAKAAVEQLVRVLAVELAGAGVRVNGVAPGVVKTGFSQPFWGNDAVRQRLESSVPLGRLAEPADVVWPAMFLASDAAAYISGHILDLDGGAMAVGPV